MDSYCQVAKHTTNGFTPANLQTRGPEDQATYRRWARAVLAIYFVIFTLGAIGIEATNMTASSGSIGPQASLRTVASR